MDGQLTVDGQRNRQTLRQTNTQSVVFSPTKDLCLKHLTSYFTYWQRDEQTDKQSDR